MKNRMTDYILLPELEREHEQQIVSALALDRSPATRRILAAIIPDLGPNAIHLGPKAIQRRDFEKLIGALARNLACGGGNAIVLLGMIVLFTRALAETP